MAGGYEGVDFVTRDAKRFSMVNANTHFNQVLNDYAALKAFGITAVRETVGCSGTLNPTCQCSFILVCPKFI